MKTNATKPERSKAMKYTLDHACRCAEFNTALAGLLAEISRAAYAQFDYNEKTKIPQGIIQPEESAGGAIRHGVIHAVNMAGEWDTENAIQYAHDILEDANCHAEARRLLWKIVAHHDAEGMG